MAQEETRFRILVVEDESSLLESLVDILTYEGYEVSGVKNGLLALQDMHRHLPDVLITDVMMPGMDGFTLIRMLRANPNTSAIPIILLSGYTDPDLIHESLTLGANMFITKPFTMHHLIESVNHVLATVSR
jgi:CheY-like chemotaxis protein